MNNQGRWLVITFCLIALGMLAMVLSPLFLFLHWSIALQVFIGGFCFTVISVAAWLVVATFWSHTDYKSKGGK